MPTSAKVEMRDGNLETLLGNGELDALLLPNVAKTFRGGDPRIRRVFPDCRAAVESYFQTTGIFPITHTMVMHERQLAKHPWLCGELAQAFTDADRRCQVEYDYPKRFSFPSAVLFLEEEEKRFGKNPWIHGLEPNRVCLEKFVEYAQDQGYIDTRPKLEDIFAPLLG